MHATLRPAAAACAALLLAATAVAGGSPWHDSLDAGVEAARKSGRPVLVVTAWKPGT